MSPKQQHHSTDGKLKSMTKMQQNAARKKTSNSDTLTVPSYAHDNKTSHT